jgi:hypothetical protein
MAQKSEIAEHPRATCTLLREVLDKQRKNEAREVRAALFNQCRSLLLELGDDVSGFALVAWTRNGELRSAFDTGYGPLRPALIPTLIGDALNRHVTLEMASPTAIDHAD